ncbi:hypothetical protein [Paremcibacter congregatus]|uniref:Uncharacterized protein n=1 Tax=Paremcibacter congregatus TaxID=2043170 RepID=A0A2G4YWK3_9PROT|nr:hypothetical protein [Paremcibacter congregatus]PHZ86722.1 hypothetical protein CRD36_00270 [Paremcibacter congregatus]QDE27616.1 hypothetical protein FIV45_10165 [Paremcibacter congregatus]
MAFVKPSISSKSSINDIADWIELKVLQSEFKRFRFSQLHRMQDDEGDAASSNYEKIDTEQEENILDWIEEITKRSNSLGNSYPFILSRKEIRLKDLTAELNQGNYAYLLCLFLSHAKDTDAIEGTQFLKLKNNDPARELFQVISTIAASGYINGSSISFGWPRQDQSNFPDALKRLCLYTADGAKFAKNPHAAAPKRVKDFEIDIVSWIPTNDNLPNKMFLVSQVASGENWTSKPLRNSILAKLTYWLESDFSSRENIATGLFIPFCIEPQNGETRAERLEYLCGGSLGNLIFYRDRIPFYVDQVYRSNMNSKKEILIERVNDFESIISWVNEKLELLAS